MHGVWQYDIFAVERDVPNWTGPKECNTCTNPSWPGKTNKNCDWSGPAYPLGCYQLTVVNALYFLLTLRLVQARKDNSGAPEADQQLADEYGFLKAWFGEDKSNSDPIDPDHSLLQLTSEGALVRERVSSYAKRDGVNPPVEHWNSQRCWAGDHGMIFNALTGYLLLHSHDQQPDPVPGKWIPRLLAGYIGKAKDGTPWSCYPDNDDIFAMDTDDYKCGIGVFMRSVLQAYQPADSPVREMAAQPTFQAFLNNSGDWARSVKRQDAFDCLNVLATMTAAFVMLNE